MTDMEEKINEKEFKIVICGGGSTYTAGIVKNLLEEEELKIKELWLYDIDQERQEKSVTDRKRSCKRFKTFFGIEN